MKKNKIASVVLSALTIFILSSCHTETPVGIDKISPDVDLLLIYNDTDTLYNAADSLPDDFSINFLEGKHYFKFYTSDDQELYSMSLIAEDKYSNEKYEIKNVAGSDPGEYIITAEYTDFPVVQDEIMQKFYLSIEVSDGTENSGSSEKISSEVLKIMPFTAMYNELGLIKEIEGDSIDFREKNGKLAFVQFMYKGCLSCVEEARDVKVMYQDPAYDLEKYSHSMFGRSFDSEKEFLDYKLKIERLPFDCFLDQPDNTVKSFFEQLTGEVIETAFFAIMPNGKIIEYEYDIDFPDWLDLVYSTAYPNN